MNLVNPHDIMFFDAEGDGGGLAGTPTLGAPGTPLYEKEWGFDLPRSYRADDLSTKPAVQRPLQTGWTRRSCASIRTTTSTAFATSTQHVGALLDALARLGLARNTVVVVDGGSRRARRRARRHARQGRGHL